MTKKIRMGIVGLGSRGYSNLMWCLLKFGEIEYTAVCDVYEDRVQAAADLIYKERGNKPFTSTDYKEMIDKKYVDAIYVATSWETHVEISNYAMKQGVAVAMEVGGASSVQECVDMVRTYEKTKTPIMLMENCCYDRSEMIVTNMAKDNFFGKIVHCSGAYAHDLRYEVASGNVNRHYRLNHYLNRNCENYPTHELGPIAKLLDINNGNSFVSLVSVASGSFGMEEYLKNNPDKDPTINGKHFNQGDIVNTIISCKNGETILLRLDTTLPRSYNRDLTVRGTRAMYEMNCDCVLVDGDKEYWNPPDYYKENMCNLSKYEEKYLPSEWNLTEEQKKYGHGGMDYIVFRKFYDCLIEGKPMPIDVYDAAAWMSVTALSEESIREGKTVYFTQFR